MSYPVCNLWPALLLVACSSSTTPPEITPSPSVTSDQTPAAAAFTASAEIVVSEIEAVNLAEPEADSGRTMGRYQLTYYHIADQPENDRSRAVALRDRRGRVLARVSRKYAARVLMQGTGRLRDGRLINIAGGCQKTERCYHILDESIRYGMGARNRALRPFRSVAAPPHIAIGTVLYIPELDGLAIPGGLPNGNRVHDGCVIAEDRGGGIQGRQLDLFTFNGTRYKLFHRKNKIVRVTVRRGGDRCKAFADKPAPPRTRGRG